MFHDLIHMKPGKARSRKALALQRAIMKTMLRELSKGMAQNLPKLPEDWDGHHLREFLIQQVDHYFGSSGSKAYASPERKRAAKEVRNFIATNSLR